MKKKIFAIENFLFQLSLLYDIILTKNNNFYIACFVLQSLRYDMNGRSQIHGSKNWILTKEINANRFFWDSHWLEIWKNYLLPSMVPNGGSVHAWLWTRSRNIRVLYIPPSLYNRVCVFCTVKCVCTTCPDRLGPYCSLSLC